MIWPKPASTSAPLNGPHIRNYLELKTISAMDLNVLKIICMLLSDQEFWKEIGSDLETVVNLTTRRNAGLAHVQNTFNFTTLPSEEQLDSIRKLAMDMCFSIDSHFGITDFGRQYPSSDISNESWKQQMKTRATEAGIGNILEKMEKKDYEFWNSLWFQLILTNPDAAAKSTERIREKITTKGLNCPESLWPTLYQVTNDINRFNDNRFGIDDGRKFLETQKALLQEEGAALARLNLTEVRASPNFRTVLFGRTEYLPTDYFLRNNAKELFGILKYAAGLRDLSRAPKDVPDDQLADYLDMLFLRLSECFDGLIEKQKGIEATLITPAPASNPPYPANNLFDIFSSWFSVWGKDPIRVVYSQ